MPVRRPTRTTRSLPSQLTVFVGRNRELAEIRELLRRPACRLLTIVGAGGTGKTRLAVEAAASLTADLPDGIFFVALQDATDLVMVVTAIARALHIPLGGAQDPYEQVVHFLVDKRLLLILDNLEHLLDEIGSMTDLLAAAPNVKLVATSREVLNLTNEWQYRLEGLASPMAVQEASSADDLLAYDAIQLFAERARRLRPDFSLEAEIAQVAEICRLVDGLPLALELAAGWLTMLTCADIAVEIRQSLDFLTTNRRDVPARHRSVRAVFDSSWHRLTGEIQHIFMQLAIFTGGFQRTAAETVAGASLPVLAGLVEQSLLRWQPQTQRYQIHELLRQYAMENLALSPGFLTETRSRHSTYFVRFLAGRAQAMVGGDQRAAVDDIEVELSNIRSAWHWVVAKADTESLLVMAGPLTDFFQIRGRYLEGVRLLAQATTRLRDVAQQDDNPKSTAALALLLTYEGSLRIRLGRIDEAETLLQEGEACYNLAGIPPLPGYNTDPLFSLGIIALIRGDYAGAAHYGDQSRHLSESHDHPQNRQLAYYLLACAASAQGDLAAAQRHAELASDLARAANSQWFMAYCLNELGSIAFALGDYAAARSHYTESYTIRAGFEDPEGMALALLRLGDIALSQRRYAEAKSLYRQARAHYAQIGDRGGLSTVLAALGQVEIGLQDWDEARACLLGALELALAIHYLPCLLEICYGAALLLIVRGDPKRGLPWLALVAQHPAAPRLLADRLQRQLGGELSYLAPDFLAAQRAIKEPIDLEPIIGDLQSILGENADESLPVAPVAPDASSLVEPLSDRELELLRLIAAGRKNREIADDLVISINTVKVHISNIYGKLGVSSRVQAVARAQELSLL